MGTPVLIPDDYVADLSVRLALYRRLAEIEDEREIDAFAAELVDRFGKLPSRGRASAAGGGDQGAVPPRQCREGRGGAEGRGARLPRQCLPNPEGLIGYIGEQGAGVRMRNDPKNAKAQQLVFFEDWPRPVERLKGTAAILRKLASLAEPAKAA